MKRLYVLASIAFCVSTPLAEEMVSSDIPKEKDAFIAKTVTAAPPAVGKNATIIRVNDKFEQTEVLQEGKNGFTCGIEPDTGIPDTAPMLTRWRGTRQSYSNTDPPEAPGLIYMMTGDSGTSNHDPWRPTRATG